MAELLNRQHALAILYDLALTIGSEVSVEPLLTRTLQRLMYHTGFPVGVALSDVVPIDGDEWVEAHLDVSIGDYGLARHKGERLRIPAGLAVGDAVLEEAPEQIAQLGTRKPRRVFLRLPIKNHGVMLLLGSTVPVTELSLTELLAPVMDQLATSITLCKSYERDVQHRLERLAYYNAMTGLPNGALFVTTLRQAMIHAQGSGTWLTVIYLDVDDFKALNDQAGQDVGDRLLVALAKRLELQLRPGEMVAHLMGDEFALLLPNLNAWESIEERLTEILLLDQAPFDIGGCLVNITASLGVAVHPADAADADVLMRHAQMAMHQAKEEARGHFRLFDAEQDRRAHERRNLIKRISTALEQGELCLFYQPQVDMVSGKITGFEALLRWIDPVRGVVPPLEFLPAVEESDLIVEIGEWVMRQALNQAVAWRKQGLDTRISVNIAGRHLQLPDFVERVRRALEAVPEALPANLGIEILESSAMRDFVHVRRVIEACAGIGVPFSLDDFGTGYSSLAYLSQLPASTVKIDQMFVRNLFERREDQAIVAAVVQIADVFGKTVIAEGVESSAHGTLLIGMGCRIAQGYGIARPMPAENVLGWVKEFQLPIEWRDLQPLRCKDNERYPAP
jgi:diguanylate cyclase (GGDEF)-like protein